ncbi:MAG: NAD-dependent epimerase/dehydratase family protein [Chlorobiaceae bacterium]|nr:NAD-dependent epimerase/dehydratase family protein [Chlorobiaceae bacterium]
MKNTVLVSGGSGYIGSVLVRLLLEKGYRVRVLDNLLFGGVPIIDLLNNDAFEFMKGDIRHQEDVRRAMQDISHVVHLAAIVGDPACTREPELAREVNFGGSRLMYDIANELGVQRFVFASTCSNYGKMTDPESFVDESSPLAPVSVYAQTKVMVEDYLLSQPGTNACKPTLLRFATVYGLSSRLRFDLTVNEFSKELALGRELVVFGEQFWRPYCHVVDLCRSVLAVLDAEQEKVAFEVFNVGDSSENYQKQMIVGEILKQLPESRIRYVARNEDPRDYRVAFEKIRDRLGFGISKTVPDGIRQVVQAVRDGFIPDPDTSDFRNS